MVRHGETKIAILTQKLKKTNKIFNSMTYKNINPYWESMTFFQIVDGYKNISRQQLGGIFITPPIPKSFSRIAEGPNNALTKNWHLLYDLNNVHPTNLLLLHDLRREYLMTANQKILQAALMIILLSTKSDVLSMKTWKHWKQIGPDLTRYDKQFLKIWQTENLANCET